MPRRRENPVILTAEDRSRLEGLIAHGHAPARQLTHARILLKADEGREAPGQAWSDTNIADALEISRSTVFRVRTRFVAEGLEAALLHRAPRRTKPHKLEKRWSVRLLAERFVELECAQVPISRELVRRTLKKVP